MRGMILVAVLALLLGGCAGLPNQPRARHDPHAAFDVLQAVWERALF